jgi:putative aldouronate transport system substrate-binding protein
MRKAVVLLVVLLILPCLVIWAGGQEESAAVANAAAVTGVKISGPGILPIVKESVKLTIGMPQHVYVTDYDDNYMTKLAEKETGIDLEFVFFPQKASDAAQKLELMVSANQKLPDIIYNKDGISDEARANYGARGVFIPLNDYYKKDAFFFDKTRLTKKERNDLIKFGTSPDGKIYSVFAYTDAYTDRAKYGMFINMKWLDQLKMKKPVTTDELYKVLKAFKTQDPNKNGKPDEIPLISTTGYNGKVYNLLINSFIYYDADYPFNVKNGKLYSPVVREEFRDAMRYLKKLVGEGLLSPLSFTTDNQRLKAMLSLKPDQDTNIGMFGGYPSLVFEANNEKMLEYDANTVLKGPKGISWCPNRLASYFYSAFITKDCVNPQLAFRFCDYWAQEKQSLITRFGEPGVDFLYRPDDPASFDKIFPVKNQLGLDNLFGPLPGVAQPWSTQNKKMWNIQFCCFLPVSVYSASGRTEPALTYYGEAKDKGYDIPKAFSNHMSYLIFKSSEDKIGNTPKEVVTKIIYTKEEALAIAEIKASLATYIEESIALFTTGSKDIEKGWDEYVKNLKGIGIETYLKTAQTAYDRMNQ